MLRKLALILSISGSLGASYANALGLGEIKVNSALNETLNAQIQLRDVQKLTPLQIQPRLASNELGGSGISHSSLGDLDFQVSLLPDGTGYIYLTSDRPIREPFVNFLLEVNWPTGRMVHEYTLLLDPPTYDPSRLRSLAQPTLPLPASTLGSAAAPLATPQDQTTSIVTKPAPNTRLPDPTQPVQNIRTEMDPNEQVYVDVHGSLWAVADQFKDRYGATTSQMAIALLKRNPDAFFGNNINRVKAGSVLTLPSQALVDELTPGQASAEVGRQNKAWQAFRAGTAAPVAKPKPKPAPVAKPAPVEPVESVADVTVAALVESGEAELSPEALAALEEQNQQLELQLDSTLSDVEHLRGENLVLNSQIDSIQDELGDIQQSIEDKDRSIRELEAKLAAQEAEEAAVAEQSLIDKLMAAPLLLAGIGGALIALLLGLLLFLRRRKKDDEESIDDLVDEPKAPAAAPVADEEPEATPEAADEEAKVEEEPAVEEASDDDEVEALLDTEDDLDDLSDLDLDMGLDLDDDDLTSELEMTDGVDEEFDIGAADAEITDPLAEDDDDGLEFEFASSEKDAAEASMQVDFEDADENAKADELAALAAAEAEAEDDSLDIDLDFDESGKDEQAVDELGLDFGDLEDSALDSSESDVLAAIDESDSVDADLDDIDALLESVDTSDDVESSEADSIDDILDVASSDIAVDDDEELLDLDDILQSSSTDAAETDSPVSSESDASASLEDIDLDFDEDELDAEVAEDVLGDDKLEGEEAPSLDDLDLAFDTEDEASDLESLELDEELSTDELSLDLDSDLAELEADDGLETEVEDEALDIDLSDDGSDLSLDAVDESDELDLDFESDDSVELDLSSDDDSLDSELDLDVSSEAPSEAEDFDTLMDGLLESEPEPELAEEADEVDVLLEEAVESELDDDILEMDEVELSDSPTADTIELDDVELDESLSLDAGTEVDLELPEEPMVTSEMLDEEFDFEEEPLGEQDDDGLDILTDIDTSLEDELSVVGHDEAGDEELKSDLDDLLQSLSEDVDVSLEDVDVPLEDAADSDELVEVDLSEDSDLEDSLDLDLESPDDDNQASALDELLESVPGGSQNVDFEGDFELDDLIDSHSSVDEEAVVADTVEEVSEAPVVEDDIDWDELDHVDLDLGENVDEMLVELPSEEDSGDSEPAPAVEPTAKTDDFEAELDFDEETEESVEVDLDDDALDIDLDEDDSLEVDLDEDDSLDIDLDEDESVDLDLDDVAELDELDLASEMAEKPAAPAPAPQALHDPFDVEIDMEDEATDIEVDDEEDLYDESDLEGLANLDLAESLSDEAVVEGIDLDAELDEVEDLDSMLQDLLPDEVLDEAPQTDESETEFSFDGDMNDVEAELTANIEHDLKGADDLADMLEEMDDIDRDIDLDREGFDEADWAMASDVDEAETKLDLARAYLDMDDPAGAEEILHEVVQEGDERQSNEAKELLAGLKK